jgi:hypothetical protein
MRSYYSQKVSESLQKIARTPTESLKPVTPSDAQKYFSTKKLQVPAEVSDYVKKITEYRKKSAVTNFGTY